MSDKLIAAIDSLKFKYLLQAGVEPTLLLLPKRRSFIKQFADDLSAVTGGEAGTPAFIFDRLWREKAECSFRGLSVRTYDGDELAVGSALH